jgi:putative acetyltransferase
MRVSGPFLFAAALRKLSGAAMIIRLETPADFAGIRAVEQEAFPTPAEADLVERLRADGDAVFSLAAILDGAIVGHAMFSKMREPAGALGLGPVAVAASHRKRGIAASLIRDGLRRAKKAEWKAVFVLGDNAYYGRFGFDASLASGFTSLYAGPHLMGLALRSEGFAFKDGALEYPAAFEALG